MFRPGPASSRPSTPPWRSLIAWALCTHVAWCANQTASPSACSPTASLCLSLANSTVCPPWHDAAASVPQCWTVQDFDAALMSSVASSQTWAEFDRLYSCTYSGQFSRYAATFACAQAIARPNQTCSAVDPASIPAMCFNSCMAYLASLQAVFSNASLCTASSTDLNQTAAQSYAHARQAILSQISVFCQTQTSNSSQCISAVPLEDANCGFGMGNATQYCQQSHSSDPCCLKVQNLADSSASASYHRDLIVIAVACAVALVLIVAAVIPFALARKRQGRGDALDPSPPRQPAQSTPASKPLSQPDIELANLSQPTASYHSLSHPTEQIHTFRLSSYANLHPTISSSDTLNPLLSRPSLRALNLDRLSQTPSTQTVEWIKYKAICSYQPKENDEIELIRGDLVLVRQQFNDGWMLGMNFRTGKEGVLPGVCVTPM
ncbi:uncharacterized protein BJ171DRAFT_154695 [Polychytrium aggregatum]|uniref:uncharacterized protein n=1 Tax=Polychytrium aggregatum TaxID=110093 RepID=UPI0022FEF394|nr:uncharacterized protein BJ171DRAFT_154695 [Polychytrium aggregatum]KAI9203199.1 hypothetical protein BJ171DRAFT_154695 [Polychytrium aggregatum]